MAEKKCFSIGNQTAWFASGITEPFDYAVSNGFDAFEWFPDKKDTGEGWSEGDLSEETRLYIKDTAAANDIRLSVHVPWRWNPFIQGSENEMAKALRLAEDIGALLMNIHFYKEHGAAAFAEAIGPLINQLSGKGISISIENTPETSPGDFNELFRHLGKKSAQEAIFGMCIDLGHANLCAATRNDYLHYMDLLDEDLPVIHVHLHENYGDADRHLPLFTGPSGKDDSGIRGFIERMKKRRFSGSLILEQWPNPPRLINEARDRLLSIIGVPPEALPQPKPEMPGGDFASVIAAADRERRSWREKLDWVHGLFSADAPGLSPDHLVYLAIYLRFLGTGRVKVSENGSHYRPSHHARMARDIFGNLIRLTTPENFFIVRTIYPWLPSFDNDFLRSEPLTRIRDIAHRNDIPGELKREIKTTLQNKLHRNAGPEDLVTSSALLERITSPAAGYPLSFVEEFKKFHRELEEFFNAGSLDERLSAIAETSGEKETAVIKRFLDAKASAETTGESVAVFEILTQLRKLFLARRQGKEDSEAQRLLAADIGMEDFSFVLLSRLINDFVLQATVPWQSALQCLGMTVENLRVSGFDQKETLAVLNEVGTWRKNFDEGGRSQLLRLKATVERCLRLAEVYTRSILSLFPERAERLGRALDVDRRAISAFAESEIRSHPVFQLSKLAEFLLRSIRQKAALPPWDIVVPGKASGILKAAPVLLGLSAPPVRPVIAVIEKVEGDEEIPAEVEGIIVPHETPHLSHLAVRARQGGVVFAVCEDKKLFADLQTLQGKTITFDAGSDNVRYTFSEGRPEEAGKRSPSPHISLPPAVMTGGNRLLNIEQATLENSGGKAFGAKRLRELSLIAEAGFHAPPCAVIPFGMLEGSLKGSTRLEGEYGSLIGRLDDIETEGREGIPARIREIITAIEPPEDLVPAVERIFGHEKRLMVRSSSNCEDMEELSGAGLYYTAANVSPCRVGDAVKSVWASLWTNRAVTGRTRLGIPHKDAHMAVLIQEMIAPDYSFIMHTVNPATGKRDEVYMELAAGFGEALTAGKVPGAPYRMVCNKNTGVVRMLSFASFSQAFVPGSPGGLARKVMDYSRTTLSTDERFRTALGERLMNVAAFVEKGLGGPQDIEGVISGEEICLVQSRPQQGVH
jgi:phosphoglucan, water dikinase